jgi:tRNA A-37 threonylcarbamoyl transferase component Bud32
MPGFYIKNFSEIKIGKNYTYKDSGVYLVKISSKKDKQISLLVKKHTKLNRRYILPYHPISKKFKIPLIIKWPMISDFKSVIKIRDTASQNGIPILPCLYYDLKNTISIRKVIPGIVGLKKAFNKKQKKTINLMYQAGYYLGKLHGLGFVYGDWKPDHIVFNFKKNTVSFIDYEQIKPNNKANKFIDEINGKFKCYVKMAIPNEYVNDIWNNFLEGYRDCGWYLAESIATKISKPRPCCRPIKCLLLLLRKIDISIGRLSRGYLKL